MSYNPKYYIYKPAKGNPERGTASTWEANLDKHTFWLTVAKQSDKLSDKGNPTFDWDGAQKMRLDLPDLADLLTVLIGKKSYLGSPLDNKGSGLFHQVKNGNTILKMYAYNSDRISDALILEFSCKKNGVLFRATQVVTLQEQQILKVICENMVWDLYLSSQLSSKTH